MLLSFATAAFLLPQCLLNYIRTIDNPNQAPGNKALCGRMDTKVPKGDLPMLGASENGLPTTMVACGPGRHDRATGFQSQVRSVLVLAVVIIGFW
jgi:hypothetical protein